MAPISNTITSSLSHTAELSKRYYYYTYYTFPVGAIVGIVIACIIIFLLLIGVCVRRNRRSAGAVPYQPQPYRGASGPGAYNPNYGNQYSTPQYGAGGQVPSQYGPYGPGAQQQRELDTMPKHEGTGHTGYDSNNPIQGVPPVYSGPGTFYNTNNTDQSNIVR